MDSPTEEGQFQNEELWLAQSFILQNPACAVAMHS